MFKARFWTALTYLLAASMALAACAQPATQVQPTNVPAATTAPATAASSGEPVTLTLGNWRSDDVKQMEQILATFHEQYPNIIVKFDPSAPNEYDAAVRTQMESGTGADLYYLRSSGASHQLYDEGHFVAIDGLPGLDNIIPEAVKTWTAKDGHIFGVGYIATSEGIYYNQDIFAELNLAVPHSWDDLLSAAEQLKTAGYDPFANASGDSWTIGTLLIQNWLPTIIGGQDGRMAYFNGDKCLNDADFVQAFQQVKDIAPYLPDGQAALKYYDSQQLFLQGEAAMWFGGSWDIPAFESENPTFQWSIFPVPPAGGKDQHVEFELDAGVGINSASKHIPEAKTFLTWLTTKQSAELLASQLPGFFPMTKDNITTSDAYANTFLQMKAAAKGSDIRFYLSGGTPDSYSLMVDNGVAILAGQMEPQEAADKLYEGVSSWYAPQQSCNQ